MNSQTAATNLHSIQHDVVSFCSDSAKLSSFEQRKILRFWPSERVMHSVPLVFRRIEPHKWKIGNPQKSESIRVGDEASQFGHLQPDPSQNRTDDVPTVCAKQDQVFLLNFQPVLQLRFF